MFTSRKRSLGQGNIFTSVCQEFCSQGEGGAIPACTAGGIPACLAAGLQGGAIPACIAGGIPACLAAGFWGVPTPGGVCSWGGLLPRGVSGGGPLGQLLLWAVRILLECILVSLACVCSQRSGASLVPCPFQGVGYLWSCVLSRRVGYLWPHVFSRG